MAEDDPEAIPQSAIERELAKAEQALSDAETALEADVSTATIVTRLYYACFHAAQAALYARGFDPQTHGQVQTWLGRELVKPGVVDRDHGRFLHDMATYRRRVEYGTGGVEREPEALVQRTDAFIEAMRAVVTCGRGE